VIFCPAVEARIASVPELCMKPTLRLRSTIARSAQGGTFSALSGGTVLFCPVVEAHITKIFQIFMKLVLRQCSTNTHSAQRDKYI